MSTEKQIDYDIESHTNFSQIVEGTYKNMTKEEVEEKVKGSFGGRFKFFGDGFFEYVAYTD